ncbi:MAG: hypothetical protein WC455_02460 [Dehalococcoidia bacterium]|jgi:hypothetical protein
MIKPIMKPMVPTANDAMNALMKSKEVTAITASGPLAPSSYSATSV